MGRCAYQLLAFAMTFAFLPASQAQYDSTRMALFKDTLDGAMDMSRFLIDYNGFIPVPMVITESALGGFGMALAPVFLSQQPKQPDGKYYPPDITAG